MRVRAFEGERSFVDRLATQAVRGVLQTGVIEMSLISCICKCV